MSQLSFKNQGLTVDWISFNIQGIVDPKAIADGLTKYFTPHVLIDDVPTIGFHGFKKKHKVSVRQYTGSKGYWTGTQIICSGKDTAYLYKLIKTQRFDWSGKQTYRLVKNLMTSDIIRRVKYIKLTEIL